MILYLEHTAERLKTGDSHQKQLELAHLIGTMLAGQKLQYLKVKKQLKNVNSKL